MRSDVKYSLTEKWENWITGEPSQSTIATKLEQIDSTVSFGSSGRHVSSNVRLPSSSDLNARYPASSSTRSGRRATTMHWKIAWAYSQFSSSMSSNMRL